MARFTVNVPLEGPTGEDLSARVDAFSARWLACQIVRAGELPWDDETLRSGEMP